MNNPVVFSIIIPFKTWSADLDECLHSIQNLSFESYEVILLPDREVDLPETHLPLPIKVLPTGEVNPAVKRDLGAEQAAALRGRWSEAVSRSRGWAQTES